MPGFRTFDIAEKMTVEKYLKNKKYDKLVAALVQIKKECVNNEPSTELSLKIKNICKDALK